MNFFQSQALVQAGGILDRYQGVLLYGRESGLITRLKSDLLKEVREKQFAEHYLESAELIKAAGLSSKKARSKHALARQNEALAQLTTPDLFQPQGKFIGIQGATDTLSSLFEKNNTSSHYNLLSPGIFIQLESLTLTKNSSLVKRFSTAQNLLACACYAFNTTDLKTYLRKELALHHLEPEKNALDLLADRLFNSNVLLVDQFLQKLLLYLGEEFPALFSQRKKSQSLTVSMLFDFEKITAPPFSELFSAFLLRQASTFFEGTRHFTPSEYQGLLLTLIKQVKTLEQLLILSQQEPLGVAINHVTPPIFWSEKPLYLELASRYRLATIQDLLIRLVQIQHESRGSKSRIPSYIQEQLLILIEPKEPTAPLNQTKKAKL